MEQAQIIICCCCMLILFSPLLIGFSLLAITTPNPSCSIQILYAPDLNLIVDAINTSTPADTLFFDINIRNKNIDMGIHYRPINLTFYYLNNSKSSTGFPVGSYVVPEFYQGIAKDTNRRGIVATRGMPWESALALVSNGSTASFQVGLTTTARFKVFGTMGKKHTVAYVARAEIDNSGEKVGNKDIKFKSRGTSLSQRGWFGLSVAIIIACVFIF